MTTKKQEPKVLDNTIRKPHKVTLPKGHPRGETANYVGLPTLKADETVTLDLTEAQVVALKRKGLKVTGGGDAGKE